MRKAFDANVPKFRPRLKSGVAAEEAARTEPAPAAPPEESDAVANAPPAYPSSAATAGQPSQPRERSSTASASQPSSSRAPLPGADSPPPGVHRDERDEGFEPSETADGAIANGAQGHAAAPEPVPLALSLPREEPPPGPAAAERPSQPSSPATGGQPSQPRERGSTTPAGQPSSSRVPPAGAGGAAPGVHRVERDEGSDGAQAAPAVPEPGPSLPFDESPDVQARRERLLQVKRKVAAAARPTPVMPALPEAPARAGESALALVRDLEGQLQRARDVEVALRTDLDQARAELARGAAEGRRTVERLSAVEQQVEEKRAVLQEMLAEMSALEEERDGAVGRAQALTALDEERQALLDGLSARAEQAEKGRAEAQAEVDRLGDELDERAADAARLRAALAQVTRERDELARELADARRELAELAEARKALEAVHEALATARARLG